MSTYESSSLTPTAVGLIGAYTTRLAELPAPEETWLKRDLPAAMQDAGLLVKCQQSGIIHRAGHDPETNVSEWRTDPQAYAQIQARAENRDDDGLLPCGHTGFRNPRDAEGIECNACGTVHDPEVIR